MQVDLAAKKSDLRPQFAPDPAQPAFLHRYEHLSRPTIGKRWINREVRRSVILAAARRLMIEGGRDHVCFSLIAEQCEISVPTIYNVVGNRAQVIKEASAEWVQWVAADAENAPDTESKIFAVTQAIWMSAINYPQYTVSLFSKGASSLSRVFYIAMRRIILAQLKQLRADGSLRPWIDMAPLAAGISQSISAGIGNWVFYPEDHNEFRREFAYGPGLMLLAAVTGEEVGRIERDLQRLHETFSSMQ